MRFILMFIFLAGCSFSKAPTVPIDRLTVADLETDRENQIQYKYFYGCGKEVVNLLKQEILDYVSVDEEWYSCSDRLNKSQQNILAMSWALMIANKFKPYDAACSENLKEKVRKEVEQYGFTTGFDSCTWRNRGVVSVRVSNVSKTSIGK